MKLTDARRHSLIVMWVDTHIVTLEVKGILAVFDVLQFILVQVRPPPQPGINNMRESFTSGHLGTTTTTTTQSENTGKQISVRWTVTVLTCDLKQY